MSMGYFPFLVDVENLHGVIIGGGHVALEKVERLLSFNGKLTLIATTICDEIKEYSDRIELIEKEYQWGQTPMVLFYFRAPKMALHIHMAVALKHNSFSLQ